MYEVLHKDDKAHVVKIPNCPRPGQTQYGYVFFDQSVRTPGPVRRVARVMTYTLMLCSATNNCYLNAVEPPHLDLSREIKNNLSQWELDSTEN